MDTLEIVKLNRVAIGNNKYMLKELADLIKNFPNNDQFQSSILTKARGINENIKTMEAENNRIFAAIELLPSDKVKVFFRMLYIEGMTRKEIALACNVNHMYLIQQLNHYQPLLDSILSGGDI